MPHEHINSSLVPRLPDGRAPERVVVSWTKPDHVIPGRDGRPESGSVQLSSEWLVSTARFASPAIVTIDLDAPHGFVRNDLAEDSDSAKLCKWCSEPLDAVLPSGESRHHPGTGDDVLIADLPHLFIGHPDGPRRGRTGCALPGCDRIAGHVIHTDAAPEPFAGPDPRPAPNGASTGDPTIPHVYVTTDTCGAPAGRCTYCGLVEIDARAKHISSVINSHEWSTADGAKTGHRIIQTEGAPTWSEPCTGFNVTLSRDDINYLIGRLRRARDEAYGVDA